MNATLLVAGAAWLLLKRPPSMLTASPLPTCGGTTAGSVAVFDPSGGPTEIPWGPYPAAAPPGYHWQDTGCPAQAQPVCGMMLLVRDGFTMPRIA